MKLSAAPARSRLAAIVFGRLTAALLCFAFSVSAARAQDADAPAAPAAPAAAAPHAAAPPNMLVFILTSVGPVFGIILLSVSICLVSLCVLLSMDLRMSTAIPPGFVEDFTDTVNKRQFKAAYEMAKNDPSYLGRVMTTGMSRLQYGIEDAREAAFNMVESVRASKDQLVAYLSVIGTLGPLIGLVGTVWGMIGAFMSLGGSQPQFNVLAGHISQALVLTLIGIGLSMPAIFCHTFFKNRLTRISMDTANIADDLLTQMYHNSKKPAPAGAVPAVEAIPNDNRVPAAAVKAK
jgi:biopolymer transport protein ExbB